MSTIINATTTNGVVIQPDNSGSLQLQTNSGTTAVTIDTSQRAAFVAGTAALPAITTTGDTNTGIFFPAADTIAFAEGGTEAMRLNSSGYVGIGTTSPWSQVSIGTPSGGTVGYFGVKDTVQGGDIRFGKESGLNNDGIAGVWSNNNFLFYTNSLERMRIDSSGNVLVGATSQTGTAGKLFTVTESGVRYGLRCHVTVTTSDTAVAFSNPNGIIGTIATSGSSTAYNTSSDYRLKENIAPMTGALATVSALKPVTYTWKSDGSDGQGFIAHELQAVVPDCVSGEKDAVDAEGNPIHQGVDTSFLVATLTAAIQEQQTIINDLKARIETLEAK